MKDKDSLSITANGVLTMEAWVRPDVLNFSHEESDEQPYVHWMGKSINGQSEYVARMYSHDADWDELGLPARVLDLATRTYDTYGGLVGTTPEEQDTTRAELDALREELNAYYDECYDVARNRTGAFARRERRKAAKRVREEMRQAAAERTPWARARTIAGRAVGRLRRSS